jgi:hypothetical protein
VLFEPTPNRGAPNAGYTGTSELQDSDVAPEGVTTTTAPSTTVDPTLGGPPIPEFPIDGATTPAGEFETGGGSAGTARRAADSTGARIVLALLLLLAVYVIVVPVLHRVRRIRRRSAAHSSNARIGVAWSEASEALELLGVRLAVGETPAEFAVRADNRSRAGTQMRELAGLTTAARYGPDASADREADRAVALAAEVVTAVRGQTTTGERIQAELDPRPALRRWWRRAARGAETDDDDGSHPERVLVGSGSGTPRR